MTLPSPLSVFLLVLVGGLGYLIWKRSSEQGSDVKMDDASFTTDLTELARRGTLEPVVGMEETINRILQISARKTKNNPLLIGEPGVGKTAAVEGLAQRIAQGTAPASFLNKRVLSLNLGELMSGTHLRGELEHRLQLLLKNLQAHPREIILFIDELHMIEQMRGSEGALDLADMLKPALSRGELQVIGATTWREYEKYLKPDAAIERRFQPVLVEEPSRETTVAILRGVKDSYEKFHGVRIPEATVQAAVDESIAFIKDRFLPDKAFDVIDEACAKVSLEAAHPHGAALGILHAASQQARESAVAQGVPTVSVADVRGIAEQWHIHRTQPVHA